MAAIQEPQSMRWNVVQLVDCGVAAKGIDVPQLEPFYTVLTKESQPNIQSICGLDRENIVSWEETQQGWLEPELHILDLASSHT